MKKTLSVLAAVPIFMLLIPVGEGESGPQKSPPGISIAPSGQNIRTDADYGKMPVYFIPNRGQMDEQVAYYIQGKDKTLYFTEGGITFALAEKDGSERWVVKLEFIGANEDVRPIGEAETGAVMSYFKGKPEDWHAGLHTYSKIVYRDLSGRASTLSITGLSTG